MKPYIYHIIFNIIHASDATTQPIIERLRKAKDIATIKLAILELKPQVDHYAQSGDIDLAAELDDETDYIEIQSYALHGAIFQNPAYFAALPAEAILDEAPLFEQSIDTKQKVDYANLYHWWATNENELATASSLALKDKSNFCQQLLALFAKEETPLTQDEKNKIQSMMVDNVCAVDKSNLKNMFSMLHARITARALQLVNTSTSYQEKCELYELFSTHSTIFLAKDTVLKALQANIESLQALAQKEPLYLRTTYTDAIKYVQQYQQKLVIVGDHSKDRESIKNLIQMIVDLSKNLKEEVKVVLREIITHIDAEAQTNDDVLTNHQIDSRSFHMWRTTFPLKVIAAGIVDKKIDMSALGMLMNLWQIRFRNMSKQVKDHVFSPLEAHYIAEQFGLYVEGLTPNLFDTKFREINVQIGIALLDKIDSAATDEAEKRQLKPVFFSYFADVKEDSSAFSNKVALVKKLDKCMLEVKKEVGKTTPIWLEPLEMTMKAYKDGAIAGTDDKAAKDALAAAFTNAYEGARSSPCRRILMNLGLILITAGIALPVIVIKKLINMDKGWGFFYDTTASQQVKLSQEALTNVEPAVAPTP